MSKVKICGIRRKEDIQIVNQYMPDYIGFVFANSRRKVTKEEAISLRKDLKEGIGVVGIFVNADKDYIIELLKEHVIDIPQLHGQESEEDILSIKKATGCEVIKAVSVKNVEAVLQWKDSAADYLLLDHGAGGTGESFDWSILEKVNTTFQKPYFIAGGLNPDNVKEVLHYGSYGVDVSGGVETFGVKDEEKIKQFMRKVR